MQQIHHQPSVEVQDSGARVSGYGKFLRSLAVLRTLPPRQLFAGLLSLLVLPVLLLLDLALFGLTRPSCAGCARLSTYLSDYSLVISFLQSHSWWHAFQAQTA